MGKIAFVFSGQGDQYPGMGKELAERYPAAAAVFSACDAIRPGTSAHVAASPSGVVKEPEIGSVAELALSTARSL